jgi:hypothetical protein
MAIPVMEFQVRAYRITLESGINVGKLIHFWEILKKKENEK